MPFNLFQSEKTGKFHFILKARNGETILHSEAYSSKQGAQNGITSVVKNASNDNFERKKAKDGRSYFVLKARNGEPIGRSEMYSSKSSMENGIKSVIKNAKENAILDLI